jgi:16S rRNA (guanine966-N2)-methyltransferase
MRIIAGEFRGRKLIAPATDATRPVTDRVKQSLFDIINPLIENARVYDCFAGTGSMGLECLSRGAAHVTFFEADRSAVTGLRGNIATLQLAGRTRIVSSDLFRWFKDAQEPAEKPNLIFLDPPYRFLRERPDDLRQLAMAFATRHMNAETTVIFRHDTGDSLPLPPLVQADVREYGSMIVELLFVIRDSDIRH